MLEEHDLTHITFIRIADLLDPSTKSFDGPNLTEEEYVQSISAVRKRFLAHEVPDFDLAHALKNDYGTLMTYRGYLKFLVADLEGSPLMENGPDGKRLSKNGQDRARQVIAKNMISNGSVGGLSKFFSLY